MLTSFAPELSMGTSMGTQWRQLVSLPALGTLLFAAVILTSCTGYEEDDPAGPRPGDRYYYKSRNLFGKLYRTYYRQGQKVIRYQTFVLDPVTMTFKDIGGDRGLGDLVSDRGIEISEGFAPSLPRSVARAANGHPPGKQAQVQLSPRLYILDIFSVDRVISIDALTGATIAKADLGQQSPIAILFSPDETRLYVVHRQQNAFGTIPFRPPALVVLDANPLRISRRHPLAVAIAPRLSERPLEITPDGRYLYLVNEGLSSGGANTIVRIDTATGAVLDQIPSPRSTFTFDTLRMSPDGKTLYARAGQWLYLIDTLTNTVSLEVFTGGGVSMNIHPSGSKLYLSRSSPVSVLVFDTVSATLASPIVLPNARSATQLQITPDGIDLLVNDDSGGAIHQIFLPSNRLRASIPTPTAGSSIAIAK